MVRISLSDQAMADRLRHAFDLVEPPTGVWHHPGIHHLLAGLVRGVTVEPSDEMEQFRPRMSKNSPS